MGWPRKIRNKRNVQVDPFSRVLDRERSIEQNRCRRSLPFYPFTVLLIEALTRPAPIRPDRSAINQRPRNGNRLPVRKTIHVRKQKCSRVLSNLKHYLPTIVLELLPVWSTFTCYSLSRAKSSIPPERSVISHRWSRHHFGLISKLRFVIYNGHVYSGPDSLFSQLCPLRADQFTFDSTKNKSDEISRFSPNLTFDA